MGAGRPRENEIHFDQVRFIGRLQCDSPWQECVSPVKTRSRCGNSERARVYLSLLGWARGDGGVESNRMDHPDERLRLVCFRLLLLWQPGPFLRPSITEGRGGCLHSHSILVVRSRLRSLLKQKQPSKSQTSLVHGRPELYEMQDKREVMLILPKPIQCLEMGKR